MSTTCMHCGMELNMNATVFVCDTCIKSLKAQDTNLPRTTITGDFMEKSHNLGDYASGKHPAHAFGGASDHGVIDESRITNVEPTNSISPDGALPYHKPALSDLGHRGLKHLTTEVTGSIEFDMTNMPAYYQLPRNPNDIGNMAEEQARENRMSRIPDHNSWDSKTSVYRVEENYSETPLTVSMNGELDVATLEKYGTVLPRGTPYIIRIFRDEGEDLYTGAISNVDLTQEYPTTGKYTMAQRIRDQMYQYYWTKYLPRLSKHLNTHSHPVGDILLRKE